MKKILKSSILFLLMILLCSCQRTEQLDFSLLSNDPHSGEEVTVKADTEIEYLSIKQSTQGVLTRYKNVDPLKLPTYSVEDTADYVSPPETFDEALRRVDYNNGVVVSGYASGIRQSNTTTLTTYTDFVVEKVYFGTLDTSNIQVQEPYALFSDENGQSYIRYREPMYSCLANDQKVFLFLALSDNGVSFYPIIYEIPLPADYMDYNEEYLTEFFDFYRGNRNTYKFPEPIPPEKQIQTLPDGTQQITYITKGGNYWPTRELSNDVLAQELKKNNMLIRIVTEYNIRVWPIGHKNDFSEKLPGWGNRLMFQCSLYYPQNDPFLK